MSIGVLLNSSALDNTVQCISWRSIKATLVGHEGLDHPRPKVLHPSTFQSKVLTWTWNWLSMLFPIWLVIETDTLATNICQRLANRHYWYSMYLNGSGGGEFGWVQDMETDLTWSSGKDQLLLYSTKASHQLPVCLLPHAKIFPCFYECVWLEMFFHKMK